MSKDDFEKEVKKALNTVVLDNAEYEVEELNSEQIQQKYAHLKGRNN